MTIPLSSGALCDAASEMPLIERDDDLGAFLSCCIKGTDAYFGAGEPSSSAIMEEFGFVPKVQQFDAVNDDLDHYTEPPGVVFHENEYIDLQHLYHNLTENFEKKASEPLGPSREKLRNITNINRGEPTGKWHQRAVDYPSSSHVLGEFEQIRDKISGLIDSSVILSAEGPFSGRGPIVEVRKKRFAEDQYSPRWVRGVGASREGYCDLCQPGIWLKIKQSAYWYHMNFVHGISATSGRPYDPPLRLRERNCSLPNSEQLVQLQGLCCNCNEWVFLEHRRLPQDEGKECFDGNPAWWRHVQKCLSKDPRKKMKRLV